MNMAIARKPEGAAIDPAARLDHWRRHVLCSADLCRIDVALEEAAEAAIEHWDDDWGPRTGDFPRVGWRDAFRILNEAADLLPYPHDGPVRGMGRHHLEDLFGVEDFALAEDVARLIRGLITGDIECV